jgi:RND family efflux transporter MFP subunit
MDHMHPEGPKQPEVSSVDSAGQSHHAGIEKDPDLPPAPPKKALTMVGLMLLVLVVAGAATVIARARAESALAKQTERQAVPYVAVVHPALEKADEGLVLPSTLQAYKESPIYARTNGYLISWTKDIGSRVRAGELLARIDTPEVDQELLQARAARQQAEAQLQLAKTSDERWQNLRKSDAVSQQEADTQASGFRQAEANLAAASANLHRLEQLEAFKNVYAPFSGVITKRNIDQGDLINAGGAGREMFDVAEVDPIRVFVNVPQAYAALIKTGAPADIELQEMPGLVFRGKVARTADSIDATSRTLLTEVDLPNKQGKLIPGSYAQVHFKADSQVQRLTVPVNTMLFRSEGTRVAVVGNDGKVHLRPITIGQDYGASLEVLQGLQATDEVIVNPADSLDEGQKVNIAQNSNRQGEGQQ